MKSNLFAKHDMTREKELKEDVEIVLTIPLEALGRLPSYAAASWEAPASREKEKVRDTASAELGIPRARLDRALHLGTVFLREFLTGGEAYKDDPCDIASDFVEIDFVPEEKRRVFAAFLEELKRLARTKVDEEQRRWRYAHSSLAVLSSIVMTANYRGVFGEEFETDDDIEAYTPKCLDAIPVAIIKLGFDEGPTKEVYFQADGRTIRLLIQQLRALEKQLDATRDYLHRERLAP